MVAERSDWEGFGLSQFQVVRCVVTGHRGRFGVEVSVVEPKVQVSGFIDFVLLNDGGEHLGPNEFPAVGTLLEAVTIDIMPDGELRLSARPSAVARRRAQAVDGDGKGS